jgi:hypothetical protein
MKKLGRYNVKFESFSLLQRTLLIVMLIAGIPAVHFLGFLRSMPDGIQRLAYTTFALEFTGTFLYYLGVALLGARIGTYAFAAFVTSWVHWWRIFRMRKSLSRMRNYLRRGREAHATVDWTVYLVAPFLLAFLYADIFETLIALIVVILALLLLTPLAAPQVALSPYRFVRRIFTRKASTKQLRSNFEVVIVLVVVLLALSYFFGQARFSHLIAAKNVSVKSPEYSGKAKLLAQSGESALLLEQSEVGNHVRYVYFQNDLLISETVPPDSNQFK